MEKVLLKMPVNSLIALFAAEAAINLCISGERQMKGLWKGKNIEYVPGRLMIGLRSSANLEKATQLIEKYGGKIDYISKNSIDIFVDRITTLQIATALDNAGEFSFVTPEIIHSERHSNY